MTDTPPDVADSVTANVADTSSAVDRHLLTLAETAARLHVSERTIQRMLRSGRLSAIKVQDRNRLVLRIPTDTLPLSDNVTDTVADTHAGTTDTLTDSMTDTSPDMADSVSVSNALAQDALALVREKDQQNAALHEKLEQLSGQVGFLQAQVQERDNQIKLLQAPPDEPAPQRRWWQWRGRR